MAGRRKRIMRAFKMDEISVVDRLAREGGLVAIMKRDASADWAPAGMTKENEMTLEIQPASAFGIVPVVLEELLQVGINRVAGTDPSWAACRTQSCYIP